MTSYMCSYSITSLMLQVTESEVQHFIHCIEKSRNIKYLQFFQTIVQGGKGSRRAQEMVVNEVPQSVVIQLAIALGTY